MKWSRKFEKCISCETTLFKHKAEGFCTRCYVVEGVIKRLNSTKEDGIEEFIVKYISANKFYDFKNESLSTQKEIISEKIRFKRLHFLRQYGMIENNKVSVDIVKLEGLFNEISRRINGNNSFYTQKLMPFDTKFNAEQRKIIALKLLLMLIKR